MMHGLHAGVLLGLAALASANPVLGPRATSCSVDGVGTGTCKDTSSGCSGGQFYRNYCPGASNIRCCVAQTGVGEACTAGSAGAGTCAVKSSSGGGCSGGTFHPGFCPGPTSTQCCVKSAPAKSPVGDKCTANGSAGTCTDTSSGCSGTFYTGFCAGPANVKCCVKSSSGGGGGDGGGSSSTPSGTGEKYPISQAAIELLESEEGFRADFYYINGHKTVSYCPGSSHRFSEERP